MRHTGTADHGVNKTGSTDISVVIVTYNSGNVIRSCLNSIAGGPRRVEVIVADNDSSDETLAIIRREYPWVHVVETGGNLGFARAVNLGVEHAGGATIVLLNPDATVDTELLTELRNYLMTAPDVGVAAPSIIHPRGRLRVASAGRFPTTWRMFCHYFGLSRIAKNDPRFEGHYLLLGAAEGVFDVDWVTGACLAVRREVWQELHGLTERWFMYAEDIEFCYRVKRAGLRVVMCTGLEATHLVGGSTAGEEASNNPAWLINLYDLYKSDFSRNVVDRVAWKIVVALGMFSRAVVYKTQSVFGAQENRRMWSVEASRFLSFSRSVLAATSAR